MPPLVAKAPVNVMQDLKTSTLANEPAKLNRQLVWFAPKGAAEEDQVAVVRAPNNPFGGQLRFYVDSWQYCLEACSCYFVGHSFIQRGFFHGRQLFLNIVDLDLFLRVFHNKCDTSSFPIGKIGGCPVCVLCCFRYAFPIVLLRQPLVVLNALGVPVEFRNLILHLLYFDIC